MKISSIVKTEISHLLNQIEEKENVRTFYACESGSRAWGFPSSDSDYDECDRGRLLMLNNSINFSGKHMGSERFLNRIVEALGIIIYRHPKGRPRKREN